MKHPVRPFRRKSATVCRAIEGEGGLETVVANSLVGEISQRDNRNDNNDNGNISTPSCWRMCMCGKGESARGVG